ncbi:MAG: hypothetical protein AABY87_12735 [bacterium]
MVRQAHHLGFPEFTRFFNHSLLWKLHSYSHLLYRLSYRGSVFSIYLFSLYFFLLQQTIFSSKPQKKCTENTKNRRKSQGNIGWWMRRGTNRGAFEYHPGTASRASTPLLPVLRAFAAVWELTLLPLLFNNTTIIKDGKGYLTVSG